MASDVKYIHTIVSCTADIAHVALHNEEAALPDGPGMSASGRASGACKYQNLDHSILWQGRHVAAVGYSTP